MEPAVPTTSGALPRAFTEGVRSWTQGMYDAQDTIFDQLFQEIPSSKQYEVDVPLSGMTVSFEKDEGSSIKYQGFSQLAEIKHRNLTYATGYIITMEAIQDNLYKEVANKYAKWLVQAFIEGKEIRAHKIFNDGFTVVNPKGRTGGDGVPLFSASHPAPGGVRSNLLAPSQLAVASLQNDLVQIRKAKNNSGQRIKLRPIKLAVPVELADQAYIITQSQKVPGSLNNDVNTMYKGARYNLEVVDSPYFDSPTAYFIEVEGGMDASEGTIYQKRMPFTNGTDVDNGGTMNNKFYAYERYIFGWNEPFRWYGNAGA